MSIRTITVQHQNGTTDTIQFTGQKSHLTLKANTNGVYSTTLQPLEDGSTGLLFDATGYVDIVDQVIAKIRAQYQPLTTLNGISPASDGTFFIHGSECDSVTPSSSNSTQLDIVDLCPACKTCDSVVALASQIEYYKTWYNMIKDINLYAKGVVNQRKQYMESKRMDLTSTSCTVPAAKAVPAAAMWDFQQLFQQYAATVQMWNYVVSQNNASTQIRTAPEDPTGFLVETKRAVPSCGNNASISCSVQIQSTASSQQNLLSVYVVPEAVQFKPFTNTTPSLTVTHDSATKKTVTLPTTDIAVAGTYQVRVKFLPFIYTILRDDKGNQFNLKTFKWQPIIEHGTPSQDEMSVSQTILNNLTKQQFVIKEPTESQYQSAKAYPSQSNPNKNTWSIKIRWTVKDKRTGKSTNYDESYYFQTNGVREYFDGVFMNDDLSTYNT